MTQSGDVGGGNAPVILIDFMRFINDMGGAHHFSMLGFWERRNALLEEMWMSHDIAEGNTVIMANRPGENPPRPYLVWTNREMVDDKLGRDGAFSVQLSNMWVVSLIAAWEKHFRPKIAELLRISDENDLKCDEMGDLNLMRNDIVHHNGIAQSKKSGKCRSLRWFNDGERIRIDTPHIFEFQQKVGPQIAVWTMRAAELEWEAQGQASPWRDDLAVRKDIVGEEQVRLIRLILPVVPSILPTLMPELPDAAMDLQALADGSFYIAFVLAYELSVRTGQTFKGTLESLGKVETDFLSEMVPVRWRAGLELLEAIRVQFNTHAASGKFDEIVTAIRTAFSLLLALTTSLEIAVPNKGLQDWLDAIGRWLPEEHAPDKT